MNFTPHPIIPHIPSHFFAFLPCSGEHDSGEGYFFHMPDIAPEKTACLTVKITGEIRHIKMIPPPVFPGSRDGVLLQIDSNGLGRSGCTVDNIHRIREILPKCSLKERVMRTTQKQNVRRCFQETSEIQVKHLLQQVSGSDSLFRKRHKQRACNAFHQKRRIRGMDGSPVGVTVHSGAGPKHSDPPSSGADHGGDSGLNDSRESAVSYAPEPPRRPCCRRQPRL